MLRGNVNISVHIHRYCRNSFYPAFFVKNNFYGESSLLGCVDVVLTDVSEELIASIFRVEGNIRKSYDLYGIRGFYNYFSVSGLKCFYDDDDEGLMRRNMF
jgi:hypothetical protein